MISRQPGLANFLSREATRANAADQRIASIAVNAGGTGYVVGDQFTISGGTGTITAVGMVSADKARFVDVDAAIASVRRYHTGPVVVSKVSGKHMEIYRTWAKRCVYWNMEKHKLHFTNKKTTLQ